MTHYDEPLDPDDGPCSHVVALPPEVQHPHPVVACRHGSPALLAIATHSTYVPDSPEARDPSWWETRVPPRAVYEVWHYPHGLQAPGRLLGTRTIEGHITWAPPPVSVPEVVAVQLDAQQLRELAAAAKAGASLVTLRGIRLCIRGGRPIYEGHDMRVVR